MPSFKETANAKFKSLREKLKRRGRKAERVFKIIGLSGILSVSSLATQEANAQTRDGNQPITELRMTSDGKLIPVRSSQQSGGRTISYQQAAAQYGNQQTGTRQVRTQQAGSQTAQEIYESLPDYPRKLIKKHGYKILPEFQEELNEPGCPYATVIQDPDNSQNVTYIPKAKVFEVAGRYIQKPFITVTKKDAKFLMDHPTNTTVNGINPYNVDPDLLPTRENMQRNKQQELNEREQQIYQGNREAAIRGAEATKGAREAAITMGEINSAANRGLYEIENTINIINRVGNIFGGRR